MFTGGGSETDALAIRGAALAQREHGEHLITQPTEHPAVLETFRALQTEGFRVSYLPVDRYGQVSPRDLQEALTDHTTVVSIMLGNAETGTIQPIAELAALTRAHRAVFHTDAAQAVGKIPVDVENLGVDLLTVVGHKMYAPKGVGALYIRAGTPLHPIITGGGQEHGLRAGTENVALIAALGAAAHLSAEELPHSVPRLRELRDRLYRQLEHQLPGRVHLNGHPTTRLPGTLNITIDGVRGRQLLASTPAIAAATGSACHEGVDQPSPVLTAMGLDDHRAATALRLSLGRWSTTTDIDRATQLIAAHTLESEFSERPAEPNPSRQ